MEYFCRCCVVLLGFACFCTRPSCSQEPLVLSLTHNPQVFRVNIREFLIIGNQDIEIGCGTSIPQGKDTFVQITLKDGNRELRKLDSRNEAQLYWNGSPFETSYLSCKVRYTVNGQSSTIQIRDVITHMVSNGVNCFPGFTESVFLMNELFPILCVVTTSGYEWEDSGSMNLEFQEDQLIRYRRNLRVIRNYVKVTSSQGGELAECTHDSRETCTVENIKLEQNLSISISPTTFSDNVSDGFRCETNLPTEFLSWYFEFLGEDSIMKIEPWSEIPWQYMITHNRNASVLVFTNSSVTGLRSVSCSTSRAGYLVNAKTNNETSDTSMVDARSSTGLVVVVIILSLICIILGAVTLLLTYKIKRFEEKPADNNLNNTVVSIPSTATEDPCYYATSADSGTNATNEEEILPQGNTYMTLDKDNDRLSTDILDNGAVVVTNRAYEVT